MGVRRTSLKADRWMAFRQSVRVVRWAVFACGITGRTTASPQIVFTFMAAAGGFNSLVVT